MNLPTGRLLALGALAGGACAPSAQDEPQEEPAADGEPAGAQLCNVWDGRMRGWPEVAPPARCEGVPVEESFVCGEYWFWRGLQDRVSDEERTESYDTLSAVIAAGEQAGGHDIAVARMYALRGQLGLAMLLENGSMEHLLTVVPDFERTLELDPGNTIIPTWIDTMELVIKFRTGDHAGVAEVAERAWDNIELCRLGNIPSLNGTAIGLPMGTGIPQRMGRLLDEWVCEAAPMCDGNTELAPWGMPGMLFEWAESYLRLGRKEEAREYMLQALAADGADAWPYRALVQDTLDNLDAAAAEFAAVGEDEDVFLLLSANQRFGCVFCHAQSPPEHMLQRTRIRLPQLDPVDDPDPGDDPGPDPDPQEADTPPHDPAAGAELVGAWAFRTISTTVQTTPIGEQESVATGYGLADIEEGPDGLTLIERGCRVVIDSGPVIQTEIADAVPRSAAPARIPLTAWYDDDDGDEGKLLWQRPQFSQAIGWRPSADADEELPEGPDDPRVFDQEGDGNPGITVQLGGLITAKMYVAQRSCSTQAGGRADDGRRLQGDLDTACSAQRILGADNELLANDVPSRVHSDPARHSVRYVRLDDPLDCAGLVESMEALFP